MLNSKQIRLLFKKDHYLQIIRCFKCGLKLCSYLRSCFCCCTCCEDKDKWEYDDYEASLKRGKLTLNITIAYIVKRTLISTVVWHGDVIWRASTILFIRRVAH